MYYRGDSITDDMALRTAEYVYVSSDPEPHRPKHASWIRNRPYFSVKTLLEERQIYEAIRNPEYVERAPFGISIIHSYLKNNAPYDTIISDLEAQYPALKIKNIPQLEYKETPENEPL